MPRDRKQAVDEWRRIRTDYPEFAKVFIVQQFILMEAAQTPDKSVRIGMCSLIRAGLIPPFSDFWAQLCGTTQLPPPTGVLACLIHAKDPSKCLTIPHEDEWFEDPFAKGRVLPEKPPIGPLKPR